MRLIDKVILAVIVLGLVGVGYRWGIVKLTPLQRGSGNRGCRGRPS